MAKLVFIFMLLGFVCLTNVIASQASPDWVSYSEPSYEDQLEAEWSSFKLDYKKQYENGDEEVKRKAIFMRNKRNIDLHNNRASNGQHSFHLRMNNFGDLEHKEFVKIMNGYKPHFRQESYNSSTFITPQYFKAPESVDWREHGYVTPIKNQGSCGSCWAFSTTGALEGQHYRKSGKLVSLSEQNLVDCSKKFGNNGCGGGLMDNAFSYIRSNHGLDTEKSYPYEAKDGKCRFKKRNVGATDTGFIDVEQGNETKLMEAIASNGPVAVAIDASHESFQFYSHGVYDEPECSSEDLDHGVLAIGFGATPSGKEYWIVKNSWGEKWGEKGYIRMSRNKKNQCGIATDASFPLV